MSTICPEFPPLADWRDNSIKFNPVDQGVYTREFTRLHCSALPCSDQWDKCSLSHCYQVVQANHRARLKFTCCLNFLKNSTNAQPSSLHNNNKMRVIANCREDCSQIWNYSPVHTRNFFVEERSVKIFDHARQVSVLTILFCAQGLIDEI